MAAPATSAGIPVVVLTNEGSASASEIVTAALKETRARDDHRPAHVRQEHRPGVGAARERRRRADHISRWFTPNHNSVHPDGVKPDIAVEIIFLIFIPVESLSAGNIVSYTSSRPSLCLKHSSLAIFPPPDMLQLIPLFFIRSHITLCWLPSIVPMPLYSIPSASPDAFVYTSLSALRSRLSM